MRPILFILILTYINVMGKPDTLSYIKSKCLNNMLVITEYIICRTGSAFPVVSRHAIFESNVVFLFHLKSTSLA